MLHAYSITETYRFNSRRYLAAKKGSTDTLVDIYKASVNLDQTIYKVSVKICTVLHIKKCCAVLL